MKKLLLVTVVVTLFVSCKKEPQNFAISGFVFGTNYSVNYNGQENYKKAFDSIFYEINKSMSNYEANSDISKINRNEKVIVDTHFVTVFKAAKQIYRETEGVFDPTIGKLVNAWDFGSEKQKTALDTLKIDSLKHYVGFNKLGLVNNEIKKREGAYIDFNAIAKGYGVDAIANFLESKNSANYLVEIGGELRAKGINTKKQSGWTVGIENPNFDGSQSLNKVLVIKDAAMATSGTYRKFKIDDQGNRYAHIINTKTGYPSKTNILSVSVIAETCMMADGYATAFQAMGIEKVKQFLEQHQDLKAYLIFENEKQELETLSLNGFPG
ncbi:FAD:protein FMN transferase [Lacinutrix salivirga]